MPSANGVYSLPAGYLAVTGATIQAIQHNPPLEDVAAALTGRLSRDGTAPMTGPIQFAVGTVSLPGAVFSTDLTSGLYKTAAGIGVAIAGTKVAEFLSGGIVGALSVGMLFPWTGTSAPGLCVLPYGQTLSRVTYPTLWTFAQTEIANGNSLYNNGDGSTTFGVPDLRGRVLAGWDAMGGVAANRLTVAGGGLNSAAIGGVAGAQSIALAANQIPAGVPSSGNNNITVNFGGFLSLTSNNQATIPVPSTGSQYGVYAPSGAADWILNRTASAATSNSISVTSTNASQQNTRVVQPTLVTNFALFAGN